MNAIETEDLHYRHPGGYAGIDALNLCVPQGSLYGFLGPNGAGKSTTLRLLLGLLKPQRGRVRLLGEAPSPRVLARVGSCIEQPSLYGQLSAMENLAIGCAIHGLPRTRAAEVLRLVDLQDTGRKKAAQFSLGMKQRLGVALALLHRPRLLLLDEPSNGLDPHGMVALRKLLQRLVAEEGVTVLVSSHLLSEVERMATHIALLSNGRLMYQGPLAGLRALAPQALDLEDLYLQMTSPA